MAPAPTEPEWLCLFSACCFVVSFLGVAAGSCDMWECSFFYFLNFAENTLNARLMCGRAGFFYLINKNLFNVSIKTQKKRGRRWVYKLPSLVTSSEKLPGSLLFPPYRTAVSERRAAAFRRLSCRRSAAVKCRSEKFIQSESSAAVSAVIQRR